jgi:hypothetical protein
MQLNTIDFAKLIMLYLTTRSGVRASHNPLITIDTQLLLHT